MHAKGPPPFWLSTVSLEGTTHRTNDASKPEFLVKFQGLQDFHVEWWKYGADIQIKRQRLRMENRQYSPEYAG